MLYVITCISNIK